MRIDQVTVKGADQLYLDGPAEFLLQTCQQMLLSTPQWKALFGENIDAYKREDYSERAIPALRMYCERYRKEAESWFIDGDITVDLIWPPSIRRLELEQIPDTVSSALLQQFRRDPFFVAVGNLVPGLNELGKTFSVDKSMGFDYGGEDIVPLTQITVNFRIDLRQWDLYLEESNRTKEDPFEKTLKNLEKIVSTINALRDDNKAVETTLGVDTTITGG